MKDKNRSNLQHKNGHGFNAYLPSLKPNTGVKTDIIQETWVDEGQGQIRHAAQLDQTVNLKP